MVSKKQLWLSAVILSSFCCHQTALAHAQPQEADLLVRLRGIAVMPQVEDGKVTTIGGKAHVRSDYVPELDLTYFFTPHIAVEAIAGTSRHIVKAKGSNAGTVELGSVWILPPTVTLQYHFCPMSGFKPYVGTGPNYTFFYNQKLAANSAATAVKYEDSFGWALQAGVDYAISDSFYLNLDVKKIFLKTDVKVNHGAITSDPKINPWMVGLGFGYRF